MLSLIDSCQNKVSADQFHKTISSGQSRGHMTADHIHISSLDHRFKSCYYSEGGGNTCRGKILAQINLYCIVDFSSGDIFLPRLSLEKYPIYCMLGNFYDLGYAYGHSLLNINWKKFYILFIYCIYVLTNMLPQ